MKSKAFTNVKFDAVIPPEMHSKLKDILDKWLAAKSHTVVGKASAEEGGISWVNTAGGRPTQDWLKPCPPGYHKVIVLERVSEIVDYHAQDVPVSITTTGRSEAKDLPGAPPGSVYMPVFDEIWKFKVYCLPDES